MMTVSDVASTPQANAEEALSGWLAQAPRIDEARFGTEAIAWLQGLRDQGAAFLKEQSFPSRRDEDWRFTDLSPLLAVPFQAATASAVTLEAIAPYAVPEAEQSRLVLVNGVYAPELSAIAGLPAGAFVGSLADLPAERQSALQDYLAKQHGGEERFTALNTSHFQDVAVVWLPRNVVIEAPIHLLLVATASEAALISPRCLVVAETGSALTLVEDFVTVGDGPHWTNAVTEVWVQANAQVNHTRVQREAIAAFHIGKTAVSQGRDSRYTCNAISLGGQISRHHLEVLQQGEQTHLALNGLTVASGTQLADTHSLIQYTQPYGTSDQLHKCIVGDRARAVFNGRISVPKAAQLTNAAQLSRNLLLSPKARVDTKPQLEIVADNVKCSHGATVSQLDTDEVFYLQSRGIDQGSAQELLIYAFAAEILERVPVPSIRQALAAQATQNH